MINKAGGLSCDVYFVGFYYRSILRVSKFPDAKLGTFLLDTI